MEAPLRIHPRLALMYQLDGTIKIIQEEQKFASGFSKREFVVTTDDQYPQDVKFECVKEKGALLDSVSQGQRVKVSFRIRGNEYQRRYFVNLQAFNVEGEAGGGGNTASAPADEPPGGSTSGGVDEDPFADESSPF